MVWSPHLDEQLHPLVRELVDVYYHAVGVAGHLLQLVGDFGPELIQFLHRAMRDLRSDQIICSW